ncbi:hypothetical protein [Mucilaginibacter psychrotolerans]|uniref:Uncharacterized protein n=1 Tax=Mucilaginibacter psychrotolerans TaxID=1524096 RepID=A0A4Y8SEW6_9SPHI|nr:hypothetical protein [Mucilaginibacter psychrotolerans]TFF37087.1 hypothetical protein E2R66_13470 [Mucilaginibacter psychrotolerans]
MAEKKLVAEAAPPQESPVETETSFFKNAKDISFVLAIYLYFSGWVYIYTYFNFFGISIRQADMEFYYFLIYSVNVLTYLFIDHWLVAILLLAGSILLIKFLKQSWIVYMLCIIWFAIVYVSAIFSAGVDGKKDFAYRGSGLLRVKFVLKEDIEGTGAKGAADSVKKARVDKGIYAPSTINRLTNEFKACNQQGSLRLLLTTKEEYIVILADRLVTVDNALEKDKQIYTIKKEDVKLARIIK